MIAIKSWKSKYLFKSIMVANWKFFKSTSGLVSDQPIVPVRNKTLFKKTKRNEQRIKNTWINRLKFLNKKLKLSLRAFIHFSMFKVSLISNDKIHNYKPYKTKEKSLVTFWLPILKIITTVLLKLIVILWSIKHLYIL